MRKVFVVAFLVNVALAVVTTMMMPERVAIHYGPGGVPDSWAPSVVNGGIFVAVSAGLFLLIGGIPWIVKVTPANLLNIPHREYWTREEHRDEMVVKLSSLVAEFGVAMLAFMAWVQVLTTAANFNEPVRLDEGLSYSGLVALFVFVIVWIFRTYRAFRVPANSEE